jgi:hypothetical protein
MNTKIIYKLEQKIKTKNINCMQMGKRWLDDECLTCPYIFTQQHKQNLANKTIHHIPTIIPLPLHYKILWSLKN